MRKGNYRPLSDFSFHFTMKVISDKSVSTGYLVSVKQEKSDSNDPERSARYYVYNYHLATCDNLSKTNFMPPIQPNV